MQTEVILIVGKRGTGKTRWAREFIKDKTRVVVAEAGFDEFGIKTVSNFLELVTVLKTTFFRVSYTPMNWEWPAFLEAVTIAGLHDGPLWLVLEEADRIPRHIPEYEEVLIRGRHYGLNLIAMTTRPANLPPDYRSQATRVIAFRQHEPRDVEYLEYIIGEQAEELPTLPRHDYLDWKESDSWKEGTSSDDEPEIHGESEVDSARDVG